MYNSDYRAENKPETLVLTLLKNVSERKSRKEKKRVITFSFIAGLAIGSALAAAMMSFLL